MSELDFPRGINDLGIFNKKELVNLCQQNDWLKHGGVVFREDPFMESDYKYNFTRFTDLKELKRFFAYGNWAIRVGVVYETLCFINQDNGGDEWWTIKKFGDQLIGFESISWEHIIEDNEKFKAMSKSELKRYIDSWGKETVDEKINDPFEHDMERLLKATKEQCEKCEW